MWLSNVDHPLNASLTKPRVPTSAHPLLCFEDSEAHYDFTCPRSPLRALQAAMLSNLPTAAMQEPAEDCRFAITTTDQQFTLQKQQRQRKVLTLLTKITIEATLLWTWT